jgi:cell division protein FtsL
MSNSGKRISATFALLAVMAAVVAVLYVGMGIEIRKMTRENVNLEAIYNAKLDKKNSLMVEVQKLEGEERISELAQTRIGLIKPEEVPVTIEVSKKEIERISGIINSKYE